MVDCKHIFICVDCEVAANNMRECNLCK